jgi:hypothetical protein
LVGLHYDRVNSIPHRSKIAFFVFVFFASASFGQSGKRIALSPDTATADYFTGAVVLVSDSTGFRKWMLKNCPATKLGSVDGSKKVFLLRGLTSEQSRIIRTCPFLKFIQPADRKAKTEREITGIDFSLNGVHATHQQFESVTGEGINVSIKEEPFDKNDIDFQGRIIGYHDVPEIGTTHATTMASIIAGAGNSSPEAKGVAWKSSIAFSDFSNLLPDNVEILKSSGISVQNHSYGVGIENYYGIETQLYDEQVREFPEIMHVFSSGNAGGEASTDGPYSGVPGYANLTGQFKMSKNTVSVGAVDQSGVLLPVSSRGPAFDGRVKPEVVAYGIGGTSESAAIVSGICTLVQHAFKKTKGHLPSSDLVKAILVNSAMDAGRKEVDYEYGFGIVDGANALEATTNENYFTSSISNVESKVFPIRLFAKEDLLKVTLVWNDPASSAGVSQALVNDLDLTVVAKSSNIIFKPWVLSSHPSVDSLTKTAWRGIDDRNNIEQITIENAAPGDYDIVVTGKSAEMDSQSFAVAYQFVSGIGWRFPLQNTPVETSKQIRLRWISYLIPEMLGVAEWRNSKSQEWNLIGEISSSANSLAWVAPVEAGRYQIRLRFPGEVVYSPLFPASPQTEVSVDSNCDDEVRLSWNSVGEGTYTIYGMDGNFLREIGSHTDTMYTINKATMDARIIAVAPVIDGQEGLRSRSVNYDNGLSFCYVRSFLPVRPVTDSVLLELQLGTSTGLVSIYFERQTSNGFEIVSQMHGIYGTAHIFYDPSPDRGSNLYRLRIQRASGSEIVTDLEEVIYTHKGQVIVYPNPVRRGEELLLAVDAPDAVLKIFNIAGRYLGEVYDDGVIKTIDTTTLDPGVYLIKAFFNNSIAVSRFVVYQ